MKAPPDLDSILSEFPANGNVSKSQKTLDSVFAAGGLRMVLASIYFLGVVMNLRDLQLGQNGRQPPD